MAEARIDFLTHAVRAFLLGIEEASVIDLSRQ